MRMVIHLLNTSFERWNVVMIAIASYSTPFIKTEVPSRKFDVKWQMIHLTVGTIPDY